MCVLVPTLGRGTTDTQKVALSPILHTGFFGVENEKYPRVLYPRVVLLCSIFALWGGSDRCVGRGSAVVWLYFVNVLSIVLL